MATNRAAQWAEPSGRTSAACVLDRTMRAAAAERARARRTARRIAASARSLTLRTARDGAESAARAWRRVRGLTRRETSADPQLSPWLASVGDGRTSETVSGR